MGFTTLVCPISALVPRQATHPAWNQRWLSLHEEHNPSQPLDSWKDMETPSQLESCILIHGEKQALPESGAEQSLILPTDCRKKSTNPIPANPGPRQPCSWTAGHSIPAQAASYSRRSETSEGCGLAQSCTHINQGIKWLGMRLLLQSRVFSPLPRRHSAQLWLLCG